MYLITIVHYCAVLLLVWDELEKTHAWRAQPRAWFVHSRRVGGTLCVTSGICIDRLCMDSIGIDGVGHCSVCNKNDTTTTSNYTTVCTYNSSITTTVP